MANYWSRDVWVFVHPQDGEWTFVPNDPWRCRCLHVDVEGTLFVHGKGEVMGKDLRQRDVILHPSVPFPLVVSSIIHEQGPAWVHSTASAVMLMRSIQGQAAPPPLTAFSMPLSPLGKILVAYDSGGWGPCNSLERQREDRHGVLQTEKVSCTRR